MFSANDIPHKSLAKNEMVQWAIIIGTLALGIITFRAMYTQIKLNKKQLEQLAAKDKIDHPNNS